MITIFDTDNRGRVFNRHVCSTRLALKSFGLNKHTPIENAQLPKVVTHLNRYLSVWIHFFQRNSTKNKNERLYYLLHCSYINYIHTCTKFDIRWD
jgi:hypothetical protein